MKSLLRELPWSARRYFLNDIGEITSSSNKKLLTREINGEIFVELDWVFGRDYYSVGLLVLVAFEKIKLPIHLLNQVDILFRDKNKTNLSPINLIYRFKNGPLEVEDIPGFYYIPFYCDYAINLEGVLINISTKKIKSWSVVKSGGPKNKTGGYHYSRVLNDAGFSKCLFLHRAMCFVFKRYEENVFDLVVNHKDGIPSNNSLGNLEWCTYLQNNLHALRTGLTRSQPLPILMKNLLTEEVTRFASISDCARQVGNTSRTMIGWRLKNNPDKVYADYLMFKPDDDRPWPLIDLNKCKVYPVGAGLDIIARNVFTGDTIVFTGTSQGTELTGVKSGTILSHIQRNNNIPINGYNFRLLTSDIKWPTHSFQHLQIYKKYPVFPPDGVFLIDVKTDERTFYCSLADCCKEHKVVKSMLYACIKDDSLFKSKYKVKLFKIRDELGPVMK